jgi:hypothetical protein
MGLLLLAGCGRKRAHEAGLEWKNEPMEITARVERPDARELEEAGFRLSGAAPRRLLKAHTQDAGTEGADSVSLIDFAEETAAFAAFQELSSNAEDFAEGFALREDQVYFRRGAWIGKMGAWSWRGIGELENSLSVPGLPAGTRYAVPAEFASLMQQKRVEGSERLLTREFLGLPLKAPVYAARYECRGDTAWIYASARLGPDFGLQVARTFGGSVDSSRGDLRIQAKSQASSPLHFRFSSLGMVGVEGCFEDSLTNFWIKMQGRALKNLK